MIDPKMLELSVYDGIPHLLSPVVTDPKKAVIALKWAVAEMEERYRKTKMACEISSFNLRVKEPIKNNENFTGQCKLALMKIRENQNLKNNRLNQNIYLIVIIVDEMADL